MMRKLLVLVLLTVMSATAGWAASDIFNVSIVIRAPISVAKLTDLDFGTVEQGATTYTVNAVAGVGSPTHSAGQTAQAASFDISGEAGATADVILPGTTSVSCSLPCSGSLSVSLTPMGGIYTHTFAGGAETYYVGGSVDVTGAAAGTYTGSETLTLLYQ